MFAVQHPVVVSFCLSEVPFLCHLLVTLLPLPPALVDLCGNSSSLNWKAFCNKNRFKFCHVVMQRFQGNHSLGQMSAFAAPGFPRLTLNVLACWTYLVRLLASPIPYSCRSEVLFPWCLAPKVAPNFRGTTFFVLWYPSSVLKVSSNRLRPSHFMYLFFASSLGCVFLTLFLLHRL